MDAGSAAMDYYYVSPEEKAEHVACAKGSLGRFPPSYILKCADDYGYIPELLELEQAAYLDPYYNLFTEIKRLIRIDDKDQFASFLNANHELVQKYPPEGVLQLLCDHSALACATALLESRPNVLDLDSAHYVACSPLEKAARNLSYGMTKLLLEHGADADIDCGANTTPLDLALDAFMHSIKGWTGEDSILKLFSFFALPELKEPLDTIRVLASYSKRVEDLCTRSMNAGCVKDYAALLMVAWDKLMVSSAEGGLETTPVGQHISRVLSNASLQQEICERNLYLLSKEELVKNLTIALYVVNTMWMPIGVLERYCHSRVESLPMCELPFHITYDLAKYAGLDLKLGDPNIQQRFLPKLTSEAKVLPERKYYVEPRRSGPILRSFFGKHMTGTSGSPSFSLVPHFQCRTLHIVNPMENRLCKTPQVKPSSHNVLALAKVCAPLMSFAKRSIK